MAHWGLTDRDDQYAFYGAIGTGVGVYARLSYKHYLLRQYVNEADPVLKDIIGGKFPFTEAELRGASSYLERYKKSPRAWLKFCSLSFVAYECVKRGPFFWRWSRDL